MFIAKFTFSLLALFALQHCCSALIGDRCSGTKCKVGYCNDGICLCSPNEVSSADRKKCLIVATSLGSGCEEERQCTTKLGRFATCTRFQCGCKPGSSVVNKVCRKSGSLIGDRCQNQHCDVGHCANGICSCRAPGEIPSPNKDACLIVANSPGSGCEINAQCTTKLGNLAHCINYQCACKSTAQVVNNVCRHKAQTLGN